MNKRLVFLSLMLALGLTGCSYVPSWMGGKKDEQPKLPGTRIGVLPVASGLQADETLKDTPVTLPPATLNADWPQHTGVVSAATGNLAAKGGFDAVSRATAGSGEAFDHTLIPRPVVGGGMVFAMDAVGHISAHDAADIAHVRWQSNGVGEEDEPQILGGGLAYDGGKLYATSGRGIVAAFDAATGKELWRKALRIPLISAPRIAGGTLFATTIDNQLYAIGIAGGDLLWNQRGISEVVGMMNSVSPTASGDTLVVPYSSGEIYALSIATGKELWNDSLSADKRTQATAGFSGIGGDPVIDGSVLFAVSSDGMLSVLDLASGKHLWDRPIGALNTPWVAGDYMFLLSSDNTLICFVKYSGRIRWATQLESYENATEKKDPIAWNGPVLVDGKLAIVSSNGQMLLVSATDGKIAASKSVADGIYAAPIVAGGRMYLIGQDATLYSIQ